MVSGGYERSFKSFAEKLYVQFVGTYVMVCGCNGEYITGTVYMRGVANVQGELYLL